MKMPKALRDIYDMSLPLYEKLKYEIDSTLGHWVREEGWEFESRIKKIESFVQKIETGREKNPYKIKDFFACTIIVRSAAELEAAEELVKREFTWIKELPKDRVITKKDSTSFVFDDLRIYVSRKPSASGRSLSLNGLVFEVQVKTIFQQAWVKATHDHVYKSESISWPKERIAYQIKAMFEQADIMLYLSKTSSITFSPTLARQSERTSKIEELIEKICNIWDDESLPRDKKRLAESVLDIFEGAGCLSSYTEIIEEEKLRFGCLPKNLSPYCFSVQAIFHTSYIKFENIKKNNFKNLIFVHDEMDMPDWFCPTDSRVLYLENNPRSHRGYYEIQEP